MKFIKNTYLNSLILCLLLAFCQLQTFAAGSPKKSPAIYSAALDNPAFPKDTVDAQLLKLSAKAWFMVDPISGTLLSSKNPDMKMYPASMTKMMTCILACASGLLNETVTISAAAASTSYGYVKRGERYKLHDLLYRVMLPSDNGAAHAVGEFLSSRLDTLGFSHMMNQKAKELKMNHTHFVNAHGLPDDNHYTTARDMMRLLEYCMENPIFAEIVSNPTRDIKTLDGKPIHLKNTNKLFGRYDGCIGVKTGTTRAAGGCLASAVVRNGMRIYLVIMKCEPARERTDESIVLYNKGFEMLRTLKIVNKKNNKDKKQASKGNGNVGKDGRDKRPVPKLRQGSINHDEMMKHQQVVPNRNKHD